MQPAAKPRTTDRSASFRARTGGLAVRNLLARAMRALERWGYPPQGRGAVELVLAEVLNNVAEHGYDQRDGGPFQLELQLTDSTLTCIVTDHGRPFPGGDLPEGRPAHLAGPTEDLPEGGFGWHLIREMTADLRYHRKDNRNELTLLFMVV
ncbi:ATP-binding protein [Marinovum sp.]|uniref:ATP-binding protein n=1 Tax=Marinovum sp. TaxID=2024839 RepID=UPI002B27855A|nr:ATP-binding protein [Marinovum sp.]